MRVASWNVNGLRARLAYLCDWLEVRRPDAVALQELKLSDELFPHDELAELGYRACVHGQKAWNGVAVLARSKLDATIVQVGLPGQQEAGARLIEVMIDKLTLISVYCPNGKHVDHPDYRAKLGWFDALLEYLDTRHDPAGALILGGDFNICPQALDSHDEAGLAGSIFHTEAERQRLHQLEQWGLSDLFRRLYPDQQVFSWWDYRGGSFWRNHGLRIDLLLGTEAVAAELREAQVDREFRKKRHGLTASDHAPVVIELAS